MGEWGFVVGGVSRGVGDMIEKWSCTFHHHIAIPTAPLRSHDRFTFSIVTCRLNKEACPSRYEGICIPLQCGCNLIIFTCENLFSNQRVRTTKNYLWLSSNGRQRVQWLFVLVWQLYQHGITFPLLASLISRTKVIAHSRMPPTSHLSKLSAHCRT